MGERETEEGAEGKGHQGEPAVAQVVREPAYEEERGDGDEEADAVLDGDGRTDGRLGGEAWVADHEWVAARPGAAMLPPK